MGSALTGFCGFSEGPVSEYYFVFASYTSVIAVYLLGLSLAVKLLTAAWVLSELEENLLLFRLLFLSLSV